MLTPANRSTLRWTYRSTASSIDSGAANASVIAIAAKTIRLRVVIGSVDYYRVANGSRRAHHHASQHRRPGNPGGDAVSSPARARVRDAADPRPPRAGRRRHELPARRSAGAHVLRS